MNKENNQEEMKECPLCGFKHNKKNATYCNRVITKNCLGCGEEFSYKCRKANGVKKYCSQKCSHTKRVKEKNCEVCGDPAYEKYCGETKKRNCDYCKKEYEYKCKKGHAIYCSLSCAAKNPEVTARRNATQIERYGALGFNTQKQKDTMIERYGHAVPAKNEKVKEKIRQTQYKNNGGVFAFNTEKQKQTVLKKYGGPGRFSDPEEVIKQKARYMEKYGVDWPSKVPELQQKAMAKIIENHGSLFGNSVISKLNKSTAFAIEENLGLQVEFEKLIEGKFFDLYIPELNLLIDLNPTITHNSDKSFACLRSKCSDGCTKHSPTSETYHQERAILARKNGFSLISMYEWDVIQDLIDFIDNEFISKETLLLPDNYSIEEISTQKASPFIKKNNLFNAKKGSTHYIGLYVGTKLIQVHGYSNKNGEFSFDTNTKILGINYKDSNEKLLDYFIEKCQPKEIKCKLDFNKFSKSDSLIELGFTEGELSEPELILSRKDKTDFYIESEITQKKRNELKLDNYVRVFTAGYQEYLWQQK